MSTPAKPKYRTTNWKEYNTALTARGPLRIWLEKDRHLKIEAMAVKQLYVLRTGLRTFDFGITRRFGQLGHTWVIAELAIAQGVRQTG